MAVLLAIGVAAVFAASLRRVRGEDAIDLCVVALAGALGLAVIGVVGTVVATLAAFSPGPMVGALLGAAAAINPWRRRRPRPQPGLDLRRLLALAVLIVGGLALRWPPMDYPLAGRDQGTYALQAEQLVRTGTFKAVDPVLADAGAERGERSGPADLLGLYPRRSEPWRTDLYEAAYRPGWYLASRNRGEIVPQFFHMHQSLLGLGGLIAGTTGMAAATILAALLWMLVICDVARRALPGRGWAFAASALAIASPLAIWVQRNSLTETTAGLFTWGAILAALRARDRPNSLWIAALLLGAVGWLRGNGWLVAPVVFATLWLAPPRSPARRGPTVVYTAMLLGSVAVHAFTSFPYVHDELARFVSAVRPTPIKLVAAAGLLSLLWFCIDELVFHRAQPRPILARIRGLAPVGLAGLAGVAILLYVGLRVGAPAKPFSRLDTALPVLSAPLLLAAIFGVVALARRSRVQTVPEVWLLAIGASFVLTLLLYSSRTLPDAGLYYYGRYLLPEFLPAACVAAVVALRWGFEALRRIRLRAAYGVALLGLIVIAIASVGVLALDPVTRLREFEGGRELVDRVAAEVPPNGIVIAGGEGWHHGHTFNQVGGALAMGHGRTVIPYRSREAAYATAYELLVSRPAATGKPPPPVFLLLGEATHHYRRFEGRPPVAAIDDLLPPPLRASQVVALEMFVHRLTPVRDKLPTRVTRDDLRMVLFRLEADPQRTGETRYARDDCLSPDEPTRIDGIDGSGPGSLVIVAAPGTARRNPTWTISIDGEVHSVSMPKTRRRSRDTLGPIPLAEPPDLVEIVGATKPIKSAVCPHGGLAQIRWLTADVGALESARASASTFAPTKNLGHPIEPTGWVPGRGLSRYRAGIEPEPAVRGVSLVLTAAAPIAFPLEFLPALGESELDMIVTLTKTAIGPDTRIVVELDGEPLALIDPPDARSGSWQSPPMQFRHAAAMGAFTLRLVDSHSDEEAVFVRDIGLFARSEPLWSE